ncbi:30S ribosomal protein S3 [bacterium]|nr:30S ribosomal protein S3 [bacterium]
MGQKVHPLGFRLGYIKDWKSKWYAKKDYADALHEDLKIRDYIKRNLDNAAVSDIVIERFGQKVRVNIHSARPGIVIGRKGANIDALKKEVKAFTSGEIHIDIHEVKRPEMDAQLVAEEVASQIKRRVAFRRAMKRSMGNAMRAGALGVKIMCSGRLGGAEIARTEWYREGRAPLQTLRADIDYGFTEAFTTYGQIGVKAWVFKGEILPAPKEEEE